jgi:hypothetical protein
MQQRSRLFFEEIEKHQSLSNFLSISGSKENIKYFLNSQIDNKKDFSLSKLQLNLLKLKNYKNEEKPSTESISILCDNAYLKRENETFYIHVKFVSLEGMRQKLLEDLSFSYPKLFFYNNFYNIDNDYFGQVTCREGELEYSFYDSFLDRFGMNINIFPHLSVMSTKNLKVEIPCQIIFHNNPFNFYDETISGMYNLQLSIASIELLEMICNSYKQPTLHKHFLIRMENSPFKMLNYLSMSGCKITPASDEAVIINFKEDEIRNLSYFYTILKLYESQRNVFQAFYTSLLLEKNNNLSK